MTPTTMVVSDSTAARATALRAATMLATTPSNMMARQSVGT